MPRTPYEVRLETLCLARDILTDQRGGRTMTHKGEDGEEITVTDPPGIVTTEQVVREAEKLYAFIDPKSAEDDPPPHSQLPGVRN